MNWTEIWQESRIIVGHGIVVTLGYLFFQKLAREAFEEKTDWGAFTLFCLFLILGNFFYALFIAGIEGRSFKISSNAFYKWWLVLVMTGIISALVTLYHRYFFGKR